MTGSRAPIPSGIDRRELGWALLLSLPVGAGVAFAVTRMAGGSVLDPLAFSAGAAAAVGVFAVVALSLLTPGEADLNGPEIQ